MSSAFERLHVRWKLVNLQLASVPSISLRRKLCRLPKFLFIYEARTFRFRWGKKLSRCHRKVDPPRKLSPSSLKCLKFNLPEALLMVHHEGSGAFLRRRRSWRFGAGGFAGVYRRVLFGAFRFGVRTQRARIKVRLSLVAEQELVVERKETQLRVGGLVEGPRADASTILIRREFLTILSPRANLCKLAKN